MVFTITIDPVTMVAIIGANILVPSQPHHVISIRLNIGWTPLTTRQLCGKRVHVMTCSRYVFMFMLIVVYSYSVSQ